MRQTETYNLKLIEASDPFGPEALNANAEALEAQLARVDAAIAAEQSARAALAATVPKFVIGSYTGNGTTQTVSLAFTPQLVCVTDTTGHIFYYDSTKAKYITCGGVALTNRPVKWNGTSLVEIITKGFRVTIRSDTESANNSSTVYRYFALA